MGVKKEFIIEGNVLKEYTGQDDYVIIPDGVEIIGNSAFEYCNMTTVIIPDGVSEIGERAFIGCWYLKEIKIPQSVKRICEGAFINCTNLMSVDIQSDIAHIEKEVFSGCTNLKKLKMSKEIKQIDESAFYGCKNINIHITDNCVIKGDSVFCKCKKMVDKNGFLIIDDILYVYSGDKDTVVVPNDVNVIAEYAFEKCNNIRSIVLPESVKYIEESAFEDCSMLETINIPKKLKRIGGYAFHRCENLKEINLPERMDYIPAGLFLGCRSLDDITIPEGVGYIDSSAFESCANLKQIEIPKGVVTICSEAFKFCTNLKRVIIAESVVNFGREAFAGCDELEEVLYENGKGNISDAVFGGGLPIKLVDNISEIYQFFSNAAIKKYLLNKKTWEKIDVSLQCEIFMSYQTKGFISMYPKCITNFEDLGSTIYNRLSNLPSDKDCKAAANFMLLFYKNLSSKLIYQIYNVIKSVNTGKNAINLMSENNLLMNIINEIEDSASSPLISSLEEKSRRIVLLQNDLECFLISEKIDEMNDQERELLSSKLKSLQDTIGVFINKLSIK